MKFKGPIAKLVLEVTQQAPPEAPDLRPLSSPRDTNTPVLFLHSRTFCNVQKDGAVYPVSLASSFKA